MNKNPTFINRSIDKETDLALQPDPLEIINYLLSLHRLNKVNPDSLLYKAAVKTYNTNIKNKTIRPSVPSWFCGNVNPETNELILNLSDQELRASAGYVIDPLNPNVDIMIPSLSGYSGDSCLEKGRPGSHGYSQCVLGPLGPEENIEVSGVDWLAGMMLVSIGGSGEAAGIPGVPGATPNKMSSPPMNAKQDLSLSASVSLGSGKVNFGYGSYSWPSNGTANAICAMYRKLDGAWNGGKFDWIRNGGQSVKLLENIINGGGGHTVPATGEKVAFMWFSIDDPPSKRSNLVETTWQ